MNNLLSSVLLFFLTFFFVWSHECVAMTPPSDETDVNWDEREEMDLSKSIKPYVMPVAETTPVPREIYEDAADDPAIWVNENSPNQSKVIGTDKRGGIVVYDLAGQQVQYLEVGAVNNVDLRYGFELGNELFDIAAASNRTSRCIDVFKIDVVTGHLSLISSIPVTDAIDDLYGFCMSYDCDDQQFYAYVNGKNGTIEQYHLFAEGSLLQGKLCRTLNVPSKPEGMVVDDIKHVLYVGEEEGGIWTFDSSQHAVSTGKIIESSIPSNCESIATDIEGLALYIYGQEGYLIASSQGNHSYAVFDREEPHAYLGSFSISEYQRIDGVEETDGIDVVSQPLGDAFPNGLFVAQDGYNFDDEGNPCSQNFKLVDWKGIAEALKLDFWGKE